MRDQIWLQDKRFRANPNNRWHAQYQRACNRVGAVLLCILLYVAACVEIGFVAATAGVLSYIVLPFFGVLIGALFIFGLLEQGKTIFNWLNGGSGE